MGDPAPAKRSSPRRRRMPCRACSGLLAAGAPLRRRRSRLQLAGKTRTGRRPIRRPAANSKDKYVARSRLPPQAQPGLLSSRHGRRAAGEDIRRVVAAPAFEKIASFRADLLAIPPELMTGGPQPRRGSEAPLVDGCHDHTSSHRDVPGAGRTSTSAPIAAAYSAPAPIGLYGSLSLRRSGSAVFELALTASRSTRRAGRAEVLAAGRQLRRVGRGHEQPVEPAAPVRRNFSHSSSSSSDRCDALPPSRARPGARRNSFTPSS